MKMEKAAIKILEELDKKGDQFTNREDLKKIKIGKIDLEVVLNYLSHKRLTIGDQHGAKLRIGVPEGRDFLMSYKKEKSQHEFNKMVAFTGAIIALVGIYTFIKDNFSFENYPVNLVIIKIVFLFLLFLCIGPLAKFVINYWWNEVIGK